MNRPDPRKEKRHFRQHADPLYDAYTDGQVDGLFRRKKRNRFPPGRRHDSYEQGYTTGLSQPQEYEYPGPHPGCSEWA
jgi:hypothetical protein